MGVFLIHRYRLEEKSAAILLTPMTWRKGVGGPRGDHPRISSESLSPVRCPRPMGIDILDLDCELRFFDGLVVDAKNLGPDP